jgi:carboxypeptidase Taq
MSDKSNKALEELYRIIIRVNTLSSCAGLLEWDERTYMPGKGAAHRGEQKAVISGMVHEQFTSARVGELLSDVEAAGLGKDTSTLDGVNIRELRRLYDKNVKIPKALVEELARVTTMAENAWVEARKKGDSREFLPWLDKVIELKRQQAQAVGYKNEPYDALLDDFEPGETAQNIRKVFDGLKPPLVKLVGAIAGSSRKPNVALLERDYAVDKQEILGKMAAAAIGFDMDAGRIDITTHPFCSGIGPGDTRITTRYDPRHLGQAFFGIMHETGHGLYDQGLDRQHYGLPMGDSISLGIHESQSRMWENLVGRSRSFWLYFFPWVQKLFWESLGDVSLDEFYFAINDVRPSFIRVEADEVTYNLHILLRFEIEHAIFSGDLKTADIPGAWNEKFTSYFGITPPDDGVGCIQDVHWSAGLIGYFPTYTLGNLYASQFFAKARKDIGKLDEQFGRGQFDQLLGWLRQNIHIHGQRYRADELVKKVTGEPLNHEYLIQHLREKYSPLYGI